MELEHAADAMARESVHRHDELGAELEMLSRPDEPRLNRAGGLAPLPAVERRRHRQLDERDHAVERRAEPDIANMMLEKFEAVFNRDAIVENVGIGIGRAGAGDLGRKV